jgi:hypothetical protein
MPHGNGANHPLNDVTFAKAVAQAFVDGHNRRAMCELFGVRDPDTITRWRRDPRVKGWTHKLIEDRVLQIARRIDGVIADRLEHANEMSIQELLAIRKEFLGGALRAQTENADDATINEAAEWLEKNPKAADQLEQLLTTGKIADES